MRLGKARCSASTRTGDERGATTQLVVWPSHAKKTPEITLCTSR